jgi:hypothetical protein
MRIPSEGHRPSPMPAEFAPPAPRASRRSRRMIVASITNDIAFVSLTGLAPRNTEGAARWFRMGRGADPAPRTGSSRWPIHRLIQGGGSSAHRPRFCPAGLCRSEEQGAQAGGRHAACASSTPSTRLDQASACIVQSLSARQRAARR